MNFKKYFGFKIITGAVLVCFLLSSIAPVLLAPRPAHAQFTDIAHMTVHVGEFIFRKAQEYLKEAWETGGAIAFKNALNMYLGQMAEQSAEYLASGGKGQQPMFISDPKYFAKLGDMALGEFINKTAQAAGFIDQSLCDPIDPTIRFNMIVAFDPKYQKMHFAPEMRCSFSQIRERVTEAAHQKFFEFNLEFEEGTAAKYQEQLGVNIQKTICLGNKVKNDLMNIYGEIQDLQEELRRIQIKLSTIAKGAAEGIKPMWSESEKEKTRKELEDLKFALLAKKIIVVEGYALLKGQDCAARNIDNFCADPNCQELCPACFWDETIGDDGDFREPNNERECKECSAVLGGYKCDCIKGAQNAAVFSNRLSDWIDNLINIVDGNINNLDALIPPPPPTLEDISRGYNPEASDLAVGLQLQTNIFKEEARVIEQSKFMQTLTGEINRVSTSISGLTKTPSFLVKESTRQAVEKGTASPMQYTGVAVADAIGVFTSTLFNKLMKKFMEEGLNPQVTPEQVGPRFWEERDGSPVLVGAEATYADLATVKLIKGGEVELIREEYAICPSDTEFALPTNCVIDTDLARAIEEQMTIDEAMKKNLLHPDWFVGSYSATDSFNDYNSQRYSLTNIKKLRRARVVPLGLEIAAQKITSGGLEKTQYRLKEIVEGFNDCPGEWCHLVDPNWVLKDSGFQCESKAFSAVPLPGSNQRQETCVDLKDCISENEDGGCSGWGYCTREKNIWRMGGDECDAWYASCQLYKRTRDNQQFSYLENTLDFGDCDENNAGCRWYCKKWDENLYENGEWACVKPGVSIDHIATCDLGSPCGADAGCSCTTTEGDCIVLKGKENCSFNVYDDTDTHNAIFFNRKVEKCDSRDEGCHEYIRTEAGLGTNLVPNGSFENYLTDAGGNLSEVKGWSIDGGEFVVDEANAKSGEVVAKINSQYGGPKYFNIALLPDTTYTFSIWAKNTDSIDHSISVFANNYAGTNLPLYEETLAAGSDWQRFSFTFNTADYGNKPDSKDLRWEIKENVSAGFVYFDDIQLEIGDTASSYKEYGSINKVYLKQAPERYNCPATECIVEKDTSWCGSCNLGYICLSEEGCSCPARDPECVDFAKECLEDEVGCELYTPSNGDPAVPGIVREEDKCPYGCLGYETFREMPTNFDQGRDTVNLIPTTGKTCSAPGCAEFTNLDEVALGGEGLEYYSYIRPCRKPDTACSYYFTWVGSDTEGYQLKRYYLQAKSLTDRTEPKDVRPYIEVKDLWGECEVSQDALDNPNCKEFYDSEGRVSYHLYPNTITCLEDCHPLRKTIKVEPGYCPTGLDIPGVDYEAGICTYMAIPGESVTCGRADAECREYKGPASGNIRHVFLNDFEEGASGWEGGSISSESVSFPGHSMKSVGTSISRPIADLVVPGRSYTLSFWAKGGGTYSSSFDNDPDLEFNSLPISSSDWQEVKLGLVYIDPSKTINELFIEGPSGFYIDNVILKEVQQDVYLIKDSWRTPCVCYDDDDTDLPDYCLGSASDQSMVGCEAYRDRSGANHYLKSFFRLCREDTVGCEALIDTQNSLSPKEEEFNPPDTRTDYVKIEADSPVYLVNDKAQSCAQNKKGCQKFGKPDLDEEGKATGYDNVFLINNPDSYTRAPILCRKDDLGCEEYLPSGLASPVYFKDPGERLCEWRENIMVGALTKTGWFKKGTDQACYYEDGLPYQPDDTTYGIRHFSDSLYQGWVGLCPASQSGCAEFQDMAAPEIILSDGLEVGLEYGGTNNITGPVANNWYVGWGGNIPPDSLGEGEAELDNRSGNYTEGNYSQHFKITAEATHDIIFAREFSADDLKPRPGTVYKFSVFGKTTDNVAGWRLLTREHYKKDKSGGTTGADKIVDEEMCASIKGTWTTTVSPAFCYRDQATPFIKGSEAAQWHQLTLLFSVPPEVLAGLSKIEIMVRGPHASGKEFWIDDVTFSQGQPYYYLNNAKLDKASCQGRVSQKQGCVLLLDTSLKDAKGKTLTTYNTLASYQKSAETEPAFGLVMPVDCNKTGTDDYTNYCQPYGQIGNDANLILKVRQDRVCGEWLTCTGYRTAGNENICEFIGRCNKLVGGQCGHFVDEPKEKLNEEKYKNRDISWGGMDYSGYSLYNMYPIDRLTAHETSPGSDIYKLSYFDGTNYIGVDGAGREIDKTCRAYPERDSPFENKLKTKYPAVNVCESGPDDPQEVQFPDCQCFYEKVSYMAEDKYFDYKSKPFPGICISGTNLGHSCVPNPENPESTCGEGGSCSALRKQSQFLGLSGYCLEPDPLNKDFNACLTWWPVKVLSGDPDLYNQYPEAGYQAAAGREWYGLVEQNTLASGIPGPIAQFLNRDKCGNGCTLTESCKHDNDSSCKWFKGDVGNCAIEITENLCGKDDYKCYDFDKVFGRDFEKSQLSSVYIKTRAGKIFGTEDERTFDLNRGNDWEYKYQGGSFAGGIQKFWIKVTFVFEKGVETTEDICLHIRHGAYGNAVIHYVRAIPYLKPAWYVAKIVENSTEPAKAFTNRVNQVKNYYDTDAQIQYVNAQYYKSECSPWGAIGAWNEKFAPITISDGSKCYLNQGPLYIYTDDDLKASAFARELFARSYELKELVWSDDGPIYCQGTCPGDGFCNNDGDCGYGTCEYISYCEHDSERSCSTGCATIAKCMKFPGTEEFHCCREVEEDGKCVLWWQPITYCDPSGGCPNYNNKPDSCISGDSVCKTCSVGKSCSKNSDCPCACDISSLKCGGADASLCEGKGLGDLCSEMGYYYKSAEAKNWNITGPPLLDYHHSPLVSNLEVAGTKIGSSYQANLQFYVWADKNQMPIREIIVDWGDGHISDFGDIMAKNHWEICDETSDDMWGQGAEQERKQGFGGSALACVTEPIQLTHIYSSPALLNVYVKDNWGWCNGGVYAGDNSSCKDTSGAGTGFTISF